MVHRIIDEVNINKKTHLRASRNTSTLLYVNTLISFSLSLSLSTHTEYKTLLVSVFGRNNPVQEMFSFWSSFI